MVEGRKELIQRWLKKWPQQCRGVRGRLKPYSAWGIARTQDSPNCRLRATENPLATLPAPPRPAKVTVWSGFTATFITGPYFFEEMGAFCPVTVTVTGQFYECLLHNHAILDLQQRGCMDGILFMQDGAPPHIANPVKRCRKGHFGNARVISRHFPIAWMSRRPDLNLCDFWLWGYLKDVFTALIAHIAELKSRHAF
ncbi:uncharacterized protein TNCV_3307351 [Trichonephila clavipes]|nr:uncharacterized protein TNCV_3307351 [Trichonephila clavipes]